MPKIVINTNYQAAATVTLIDELIPRLKSAGYQITRNDWHNYRDYDFAFFMSPDSQVAIAKSSHPNIKTLIMDPKESGLHRINEMKQADLLVTTSLEHTDHLLKYNSNIFTYFSFPNFKALKKKHTPKDKFILGYHGNREHLNCFEPTINRVLDGLSKKYDIELWAMYNIKKLGRWKTSLPKLCPVKHIQWSPTAYYTHLSQADIGICNNLIPHNLATSRFLTRYYFKRPGLRGYPYRNNDLITRYKYSTNPSRIYVFGMLGIPVVSDFTPSTCQVITHGHNGYLANSASGWYYALEQLIKSYQTRQFFADHLQKEFTGRLSTHTTFQSFHARLQMLTISS